jgi:acyl-CoA synthetase (NDP forming)
MATAALDRSRIERILAQAAARGDEVLVEPDGFPLLEAAGIRCARSILVSGSEAARTVDTSALSGDRIVVKVASSAVLHRSEAGGVAVVANRRGAILHAIAEMEQRVPREGLRGFTLNEFVPHHGPFGAELLLGLRDTADFGPVVTLGAGGIYTEFLARHFAPGAGIAILSAVETDREAIAARLARLPVVQLLTGGLRGQPAQVSMPALVDAVETFAALGRAFVPHGFTECEVNPLVVAADDGLVALDVLIRRGAASRPLPAPRPLPKIGHLLEPRRVAIVGVSAAMNPGRIILENLRREGFPARDLFVVKPGVDEVAGCPAVPDLAALPGRVDLLVLAVAAAQVPRLLEQCLEHRCAESVIVIPGGLEEKAGGASLASVQAALAEARGSEWLGPVINGGNCLGVRSAPGRCDTMFIPPEKLPPRTGPVTPLAVVSQSGAFAIARASTLAHLNPRYLVTVGNQVDLTVGDYLTYFAERAEDVEVFAVYVEGFRPRDGLRVVEAARRLVARGKTVVLYRNGRTAAGAAASASHTASIAGDYAVTRELALQAGVVVADSLADFDDLVSLCVSLRGRRPAGTGLGAISNAGFECVAMADALGSFTLAPLADATRARLAAVLAAARVDGLVDIHNPLDLTPMAGDAVYEDAVAAMLDDPGVDAAVVGCVPLTAALATLPAGVRDAEDGASRAAIGPRLARLFAATAKPWVVVVDSGAQYDPLARALSVAGVPVFRTADRAVRLLGVYCDAAQRNAQGDRAPSLPLPVAAPSR